MTAPLHDTASDARLSALASAAAILDWPLPRERDEATCQEAAWVERARTQTVRALKAAAKGGAPDGLAPGRNAPGEFPEDENEKWTRMRAGHAGAARDRR